MLPNLVGCDFSSSPGKRKPIVVAHGSLHRVTVVLDRLEKISTLDGFSAWLVQSPGWVGGFDFPFGLPRELVTELGWPQDWNECMRQYAAQSRDEIKAIFKAFCNRRPKGQKFAHRACDRYAGSSPSMKWVNPPVAWMLHAGVPRLLAAGVGMVGQCGGNGSSKALEAYPGLLAREIIGRRSYKSDTQSKQTGDRLIARKDIITGLEAGRTRLGLRVKLSHAQRDALTEDASGDSLDAVLCLMQAAWGLHQSVLGAPLFGLPSDFDRLEGWIVTVPNPAIDLEK